MEHDSDFLAFGYENAEGEAEKRPLGQRSAMTPNSNSNRNGNRSRKSMPNTRPELLTEAGTRHEQTLEAVSSRPLLGAA